MHLRVVHQSPTIWRMTQIPLKNLCHLQFDLHRNDTNFWVEFVSLSILDHL